VTLESFAAGVPVVTSNIPENAARELVLKSGFGYLAELNTSNFVEKILTAISDSALREKITREKEKFLKNYEIDFIATHLERYYKKVIEEFSAVRQAALADKDSAAELA
jgi:glycosyltransferase involved in cell wall biosynthesis